MADYGASFFSSVGTYVSEAASAAGTYIAENPGTVLQAVGAAATTASSIQQASAQAKQGEAQADIIDLETRLERDATQRRNRQILGRNRAVAAGAGVNPFSGSPLEIELANAFEAGMNEELIDFSGKSRAALARMGAKFQRQAIPGMAVGGFASAAGKMWEKSRPPGTTTPSMKRASSFDSYWGG